MTNDNASFREEARNWLKANFPTTLAGTNRALAAIEDPATLSSDDLLWRRRMGEKGWGVPTWPKQYGGGGLSAEDAGVLAEEMARIGAANPIVGMGPMMLGPTLLLFGTEDQKRRHLSGIASGEVRWCQGYSEPGAGSDLASLSTFAADKGDHYLVNGQKTWTSGAQWSDWCFALVRTDKHRKHEGITFLLIDMRDPGVQVRPIRLISGSSPFCDTFFTDVKVPKTERVGEEGQGWSIGKQLLQFERAGIARSKEKFAKEPARASLAQLAMTEIGADARGKLANGDLRVRLTALEMKERALELTRIRLAQEAAAGRAQPLLASVLKNVHAEVTQARDELALEISGLSGLGAEGDGFTAAQLEQTKQWLWNKALSIFGGTTEIQNNIIAKRILDMPDKREVP